MRRSLLLIGACVLLFAVKIEGVKSKNQQRFWELWDSDTANNEPGKPDNLEDGEFTIDDDGGSGNDDDTTVNVNTHEDDEDFEVNSGDGEPETAEINKEKPPTITDTDDEDDLFAGSGSGDDTEDEFPLPEESEIVTEKTVTSKSRPLSACETLRNSVVDEAGFKPECDMDGQFKRRQCTIDMRTKIRSCWCVASDGSQIPGTLMNQPDEPDCDYGTNLKGCVFERVQNGQNLLGAPKPRCDINGDWEPIQCLGSQCWCVDKFGNQELGSFVDLPDMPKCDAAPTEKTEPTTKAPVKELPKPGGGYTVAPSGKDTVIVTDIVIGKDNSNSNFQEGYRPVEAKKEPILGQPGFLAAIIAGGVITLLLVVLLVMFIVYRMRKKDEGSYPLDEQKFQNYSYSKAPDKEFYA